VACHWVEQIAAGDLEAHEVDPELVEESFTGDDPARVPLITDPGM
jgi:hypothetical protein